MGEYHINFDCGCVLDRHGDDQWCPDHRHIWCQREGASHRSGDELLGCYLDEAMGVKFPSIEHDPGWAPCLDQCGEDHAENGAWLENDDLREELAQYVQQAESRLGQMGWWTDWDDGFVIWRPSADNPVAEYRHRIEIDSPEAQAERAVRKNR